MVNELTDTDKELYEELDRLEKRLDAHQALTARDWTCLDHLQKKLKPEKFTERREASRRRIRLKQARELSLADLKELVAEKEKAERPARQVVRLEITLDGRNYFHLQIAEAIGEIVPALAELDHNKIVNTHVKIKSNDTEQLITAFISSVFEIEFFISVIIADVYTPLASMVILEVYYSKPADFKPRIPED